MDDIDSILESVANKFFNNKYYLPCQECTDLFS